MPNWSVNSGMLQWHTGEITFPDNENGWYLGLFVGSSPEFWNRDLNLIYGINQPNGEYSVRWPIEAVANTQQAAAAETGNLSYDWRVPVLYGLIVSGGRPQSFAFVIG